MDAQRGASASRERSATLSAWTLQLFAPIGVILAAGGARELLDPRRGDD
jgi:hypothetical protein